MFLRYHKKSKSKSSDFFTRNLLSKQEHTTAKQKHKTRINIPTNDEGVVMAIILKNITVEKQFVLKTKHV